MNTIELKMAALSVAVEARQPDEPMHVVYEQAQAIYEWLMEDAVLKEKPPGDGQGVLKFPN